MSQYNKHAVKLPTGGYNGPLLSEVVRAHLHGANASAMLERVASGVEQYLKEADNAEDIEYGQLVLNEVKTLVSLLKQKEDKIYSGPFNPYTQSQF